MKADYSIPDGEQVFEQVGLAVENIEKLGSDYPDDGFEEGFIAAVQWMSGLAPAPFGQEEEREE